MASSGTARVFSLLATTVRVVCTVIAALILVYAVFVLFDANKQNVLVTFTHDWRQTFGWFTNDLFQPSDAKMGEAINAGLAALIWVVAGSLLSKLIVRFTPTSSDKARA